MEGTLASDGRAARTVTQKPHSARVRHLLAVAREQFVAAGFEAVSIDAIARASGVSKETIYRYYPDKEALFRAAAEEMGSEFSATVERLHRARLSPGDELVGMARTILDSAIDGGLLSAVWVSIGIARIMPEFAQSLLGGQSGRLEPVCRLLEEIAAARGIEVAVPLELAEDFGSLSAESPALLMGFAAPAAKQRDAIAHRVADLFENGLLSADGSASGECLPQPVAPVPGLAPAAHIRNLLDVASAHFLESGFQSASLDVIGAEAAVGRGTLYRHFGSKAGLFAATMRDHAFALAGSAMPPPLPAGQADEAAFAEFLCASLAVLGGEQSIALHRTVIAESRRDPELARDVYAIIRAPWLHALAAWLESLRSAGKVKAGDPAWYARQALVLALKGNRVIAGGLALSPAEARRAAERTAAIMLRGFAAVL